ncbi:hypothetical protein WN943_029083 [Citrus x changshan-huyou]
MRQGNMHYKLENHARNNTLPEPKPLAEYPQPSIHSGHVAQPRSLLIQQRSSSDLTKPLIDQLQKHISDVERADGNKRAYESGMLDLTVKL